MITLFTLPNCPRCEEIKEFLDESGTQYITRSMDDPEALADLRFGGCFEVEAPIIQIGDDYFTYEEFMKREKKEKLEG